MPSAESKPQAEFKYAGWIPTVAGRLSFRHVGESRHPTYSVYANVAADSRRILLGYQKRPLSDALFPRLTNRWTQHSGDFWFVIHAENPDGADTGDAITGTIYLYKSESDWLEKAKTSLAAAIKSLNALRLSNDAARDALVVDHHERAQDVLLGTADISTKFKMQRTGEVYFSEPTFLDPVLKANSIAFATRQRHDFLKWIADQAYFFLRDISHQHQHHDLTEDTILILRDLDAAGLTWREQIIYSLYFRIIRAKRSHEFPDAIRALGIMAYCRSFKNISRSKFKQAQREMPIYNDIALRESIRARIEEDAQRKRAEETKAINRATSAANFRIVGLTLVLAALTVIAIFAPEIVGSGINEIIAKKFAPYLLPALAYLMLAIIFIMFVSSSLVLEWKEVMEISLVRRKEAAAFYMILVVFILGLVLLLAPVANRVREREWRALISSLEAPVAKKIGQPHPKPVPLSKGSSK